VIPGIDEADMTKGHGSTIGRGAAKAGGSTSDLTPWHLVELDIIGLHRDGLCGEGVCIGVVDTGVARHPDLPADQITAIDSSVGFDPTDHNGHGTGMIGILLGAQGAMCPKAHVISARAATGAGGAEVAAVVAVIDRLIAMDVDIISISMGTRTASDVLAERINSAASMGVVVVAASEDGPSPVPLYPGFYSSVIAVTSVNRKKKLVFPPAPAWVDVAAPGHNIATLGLTGRATLNGTSPAAAICTGVAALLLGMAAKGKQRRELGKHLLGFFRQVSEQPWGAAGPGDPQLLIPRKLSAAVKKWLSTL
jgi:hypothetical protein